MFDRLREYFLGEPRRLISLGVAMVRCGGLLRVAGLVGFAATTADSVARGMATHARPEVPLTEALPIHLSWWMGSREADDDMEFAQGGAAITSWARFQFTETATLVRDMVADALRRYCELDTLAMVTIYEAWRE
jgi:hypothetical protein